MCRPEATVSSSPLDLRAYLLRLAPEVAERDDHAAPSQ
jgi:hypothetical protein